MAPELGNSFTPLLHGSTMNKFKLLLLAGTIFLLCLNVLWTERQGVAQAPDPNRQITRERPLPSDKATAYADFVKKHVPYPVEVSVKDGKEKGTSIIAFTGPANVVF